jgi:hypothetical protein
VVGAVTVPVVAVPGSVLAGGAVDAAAAPLAGSAWIAGSSDPSEHATKVIAAARSAPAAT